MKIYKLYDLVTEVEYFFKYKRTVSRKIKDILISEGYDKTEYKYAKLLRFDITAVYIDLNK